MTNSMELGRDLFVKQQGLHTPKIVSAYSAYQQGVALCESKEVVITAADPAFFTVRVFDDAQRRLVEEKIRELDAEIVSGWRMNPAVSICLTPPIRTDENATIMLATDPNSKEPMLKRFQERIGKKGLGTSNASGC